MLKRCIFFVFFILFFSCQGGWSHEDLGNGIIFNWGAWKSIEGRWDNLDTLTIFSKVESYDFDEKFIIALQKPDFKTYTSEFSDEVIFDRFGSYETYLDDSLFYKKKESYFPKKYVPALLGDSIIYKIMKSKNYTHENDNENIDIRNTVADSIIRNDPYHKKIFSKQVNYWIIDKGKMKLFGPYTKEEFYQKRKEFGVSDNLEFDKSDYN